MATRRHTQPLEGRASAKWNALEPSFGATAGLLAAISKARIKGDMRSSLCRSRTGDPWPSVVLDATVALVGAVPGAMRFAPLTRLHMDGVDDVEGVSHVVPQSSDDGGGQASRTAALMIATMTMSPHR
jgi:hypothetical protein